ncbi:hypothetical protein E3N88_37310 [Mikania micrantha]|uniref:protein-disulfide reductase n=1 Tax=Mikania micrantha TaxID=192012 RepID=A0A5N6LQS8_9ASTR|nr:hypothetical protein E3N88_37310 [Mikania micrantha]
MGGGDACESVDFCTLNFKTIMKQEGVHHLLYGEQKVPLPSGKEKTLWLLFSANWSRPCKAFIPQLVQAYNTLKETGKEIEVIFVSFDRDENEYEEHIKGMPWLVVPFNLILQTFIGNAYKVNQIPLFIPLDVGTKLLSKDAVGLINDYGADAFPFTKNRQEELKALDEAKRGGGNLIKLFTNGIEYSFVYAKGGKDQTGKQLAQMDEKWFHHMVPEASHLQKQVFDEGKRWIASTSKRHVCGYDLHPTCIEETL